MIEIKNINAGYDNASVLSDMSLCIKRGELVSVIGSNGCGKSTLLKAILGIISPSSGEIIIDDTPSWKMDRKDLAKRIAYLPQNKNIPDMTVGQLALHGRFPHLGYPRHYSKEDKEKALWALQEVGILDLYDRPLSSLSGGMRQNAYIAMALSQDTDYILLDEPTSSLDITHQLKLLKTLRTLSEAGRGILIVMHDLPLAFSYSDRICLIKDGHGALYDTPANAKESALIKDTFDVTIKYEPEGEYYYYKLK